jgi:F-type H+-transporting ATPase subunit gamma
VKSIQKITKSMKMVSAAKFAKAERELRAARSYGVSAKGERRHDTYSSFQSYRSCLAAFYDNLEVESGEGTQKHLFIAATSDRGLCGAANTSIVKNIRAELADGKTNLEATKVIAIGDKSRAGLARTHAGNILLSVNEIGKRSVVFGDASAIAQQLLQSGFEFDSAEIVYNKFK